MIRLPAVAGRFYSASEDGLRTEVRRAIPDTLGTPVRAIAAIAPHAGLMYSGGVAAAVYAELIVPPSVVLIGPNHSGQGPTISVFPEGAWVIPGGEVLVNRTLTNDLLHRFPSAQRDTMAHQFEHCLEVQLPFLLHGRNPLSSAAVQIVAVVVGMAEPDLYCRLGEALASLIRHRIMAGDPAPTLIASTDMNHYESDELTRQKDRFAIEAIEALDGDRLYREAQTREISMCGLGPVLTVITAARALGATRASLRRYGTSADVSGDRDRVVGYAGFLIN